MRPLLLVLFLVGGCTTPRPPKPIANHAPVTPLVCSEDAVERLRDVLERRWSAPALHIRCTAGRFGSAGYFIEATIDGRRRTGIVDASGAELVPFIDEPRGDAYTFITGYRAADLDNDGEDEIIESWRRNPTHALHPDNWLVIRVVSNKRLLRIKGPFLSRYHPGLGSCSGTWQLRRGAIYITVSVEPGIPPTDCLPAGKHRFELRGSMLVDARGR